MTEERMKGQLETLEMVYAHLTDGRALIAAEKGMRRWFDDGAEARSLEEAVAIGRALVRFVMNQARQYSATS